MIVRPIKTDKILVGSGTIFDVLDKHLNKLGENIIVAITSKVVSICENSLVPIKGTDKEDLIINQADYYLPAIHHKYGYHFSVVDNTLISSSGIDESNGDDHYVLWPKDSQASANQIRAYLADKYQLENIGVIITDSTSKPMRRGTTGICLAHSGFMALNDYRHKPDLFGHKFRFSVANVAEGLATAAVVTMGEGTEQTPLATIEEAPFVTFQDRNPNPEELSELRLTLEDDYFELFFNNVPWQPGGRTN